MTALLKPLSESPATPTAGPRNSMSAAAKRSYLKTWREFGIDDLCSELGLPSSIPKPQHEPHAMVDGIVLVTTIVGVTLALLDWLLDRRYKDALKRRFEDAWLVLETSDYKG
jgi:hypothetical protein